MPPAPPSIHARALVLLSCGDRLRIETLHQQSAAAVARGLGLQLAAPLGHDPAALAELAPNSLTPLPLDPGLSLEDGYRWAEILGAWRQSALLLLSGDQLATGAPAATTALLRQWKVPLLGLVQWGGDWDGAGRRADGLPWLGWLANASDPDQAVALALRARLRWQQLAADLEAEQQPA